MGYISDSTTDDPLAPKQYSILCYLLHLSESFRSPGTAINYLSGARTWVRGMGGDLRAFDTYALGLLKRGIQRASSHVAAPARPFTRPDLIAVLHFLSSAGTNSAVLAAAIAMGFFSLLRQSNLLLSPTRALARHALRVDDVTRTPEGIRIRVRHSKTSWRAVHPHTINIPAQPAHLPCAVRAWDRYAASARLSPSDPAFMIAPGLPLRASHLVAVARLALTRAGHPSPGDISMHSLRRGGAQDLALRGASLADVRDIGAWRSDAVFAYVPRIMFGRLQPPIPNSLG